jgi:hypothetical protein
MGLIRGVCLKLQLLPREQFCTDFGTFFGKCRAMYGTVLQLRRLPCQLWVCCGMYVQSLSGCIRVNECGATWMDTKAGRRMDRQAIAESVRVRGSYGAVRTRTH